MGAAGLRIKAGWLAELVVRGAVVLNAAAGVTNVAGALHHKRFIVLVSHTFLMTVQGKKHGMKPETYLHSVTSDRRHTTTGETRECNRRRVGKGQRENIIMLCENAR